MLWVTADNKLAMALGFLHSRGMGQTASQVGRQGEGTDLRAAFTQHFQETEKILIVTINHYGVNEDCMDMMALFLFQGYPGSGAQNGPVCWFET